MNKLSFGMALVAVLISLWNFIDSQMDTRQQPPDIDSITAKRIDTIDADLQRQEQQLRKQGLELRYLQKQLHNTAPVASSQTPADALSENNSQGFNYEGDVDFDMDKVISEAISEEFRDIKPTTYDSIKTFDYCTGEGENALEIFSQMFMNCPDSVMGYSIDVEE